MTTKKTPNDFDISEVINTTTEHQKTLDDILKRVDEIEECLKNPDKMGEKMSASIEKSTPLRKSFSGLIVELMDDYETRKKLQTLLSTIDRKAFWRWGKYILGAVAWTATVVAAIFAYIAIKGQ